MGYSQKTLRLAACILVTPAAASAALRRRRRAIGHQCPDCHRPWALQVVDHPAGKVIHCRFCRNVRRVLATPGGELVSSR